MITLERIQGIETELQHNIREQDKKAFLVNSFSGSAMKANRPAIFRKKRSRAHHHFQACVCLNQKKRNFLAHHDI